MPGTPPARSRLHVHVARSPNHPARQAVQKVATAPSATVAKRTYLVLPRPPRRQSPRLTWQRGRVRRCRLREWLSRAVMRVAGGGGGRNVANAQPPVSTLQQPVAVMATVYFRAKSRRCDGCHTTFRDVTADVRLQVFVPSRQPRQHRRTTVMKYAHEIHARGGERMAERRLSAKTAFRLSLPACPSSFRLL